MSPRQNADHTEFYRSLVDHTRYPIDRPQAPRFADVIMHVRNGLAADGCAVLEGFLSEAGVARLLAECRARRANAYFSPSRKTNVYFSSDDPALPAGHPRRIFLERSNGFITSDLFGAETAARRLYHWPPLTAFVAACLGRHSLYIYDDPVSNMIVNVGVPGSCFNWHFDTNEFTITLLLQAAASGGHFEYVPNLRDAQDEHYDTVKQVLDGDTARVKRLPLRAGDLQLFLGRFSLHRVTENTGTTDRLLLIMSFAGKPGMIGSVHRTRELYGKVTAAHVEAECRRVRSDALID